MRIHTSFFSRLACCALLGAGLTFSQTAPDNTKVNKGDGAKGAVTADKQKNDAGDRQLTQNIRKSLMADKALSTYAHNVKVISQDGKVTLRGPVRSEEEKRTVASMAADAAGGATNVNDQMEVKPAESK